MHTVSDLVLRVSDPAQDSHVRGDVEIRSMLEEYYRDEGKNDPLRIV